jgi:hypothetical protein
MEKENNIIMRKIPFPYYSGLSICNDIDGNSFKDFITIHSFLNTKRDTPLGEGVNLELSDSFWFYSNKNTPDHAFSYFTSDGNSQSKYAPQIRELIKAGYIDVLHTYGNFSKYGGFSRKIAELCAEEMEKNNLDLEIWVNHGDYHNLQNIGFFQHWLGDKPTILKGEKKQFNNYYHLDILISLGFTFFWDAEFSLTQIIGQNRNIKWHEAYMKNQLMKTPKDFFKNGFFYFIDGVNRILGGTIRKHLPNVVLNTQNNELIEPELMNDGHHMLKFKRYGSALYDWEDDLSFLLHKKILEELIKKEGLLILYVHWGDKKNKFDLPFSKKTVDAFHVLADLFNNGKIWVTTTKKILNYAFIYKYLNWRVEAIDGKKIIFISGHTNSRLIQKNVKESDLEGLTFYTIKPELTQIIFKNKILNKKINPKDHTGKYSISVPLNPLIYPL